MKCYGHEFHKESWGVPVKKWIFSGSEYCKTKRHATLIWTIVRSSGVWPPEPLKVECFLKMFKNAEKWVKSASSKTFLFGHVFTKCCHSKINKDNDMKPQVSKRHVESERLLKMFVAQHMVCFCFDDVVLELLVFEVPLLSTSCKRPRLDTCAWNQS